MVQLRIVLPFLLCLCLASSASVFSLTTDYSKPAEWTHSGSQAGGTMLFVDGTNLMTHDPDQVQILIGDQLCVFDHFLMKESYIECTVPPLPSSAKFPNVTISVLFNKQPVYISPSANPVFIYTPDKTAVVYGVCPAQQSPLRPLAFYGSWKTEGDNSLYMEIRAANRHMEFLPEFSTFQSWGSTFIATNLGDNLAGETDPTVRLAASYGFAKFHWTAKQYSLAGKPYLFKALAEIKSLSYHSGSTAGGLEVTITGAGFPNKTSQVTADIEGNSCLVTSVAWDTVKCTTSARILTEAGPNYEGGSGLKHHLWYNKTKSLDLVDTEADIIDIVPMAESFPPNNDDVDWIFVERWVGFFKAPRSGDFTFYVSSDDSCEVWLSTDSTVANKARIINFGSYTNFRDMLSRTSTRSLPITLVSGQLYYLEIWHQQWGGNTHFSMGVQIPSPGAQVGNYMPSVQLLSIVPGLLTREVQRVTITGTPTGGSIAFTYKGKTSAQVAWPAQGTKWTCGDIISAMKDMGISSLSCSVAAIDKLAYDFTFTYAWTDLRGLIGTVLSNVRPTGLSAATTQAVKPSKPLVGTYRLSWKQVTTGPISMQTSPSALQIQLNANFTDFGGNLLVAGYANADGVQMQFIFGDSLNPEGTVPLVSAVATAVLGPDEAEPVVTVTEAIPASTNQFWWAVPNEFFRTIETFPVLRVYANSEPAICRGNCAFEYSVDSPTISTVAYAPSVTMTGLNLRNACDVISVSIGGTACPVTSCSLTSIVCDQGVGLVGTYKPKVLIAGSGLAVLEDGLTSVTYPLTITSVSPATGSIGGGTILTIAGTGFLPSLDYPGVTQSVTVGTSECHIQTTSGNTLTCITSPQLTTNQLTLLVGTDSAISADFSYDLSSSPMITSVSPDYASTIVKTQLTITGTNFVPLKAGDQISIFVGAVECYYLTSTATSITCNLLGGPTGKWLMVVSIPGRGNAVKEQYPLIFQLTSVTPNQGSINGGTLLTLVGKGFSTRASQMLVMFEDKAHICDIVGSPTEQQVKCRTAPMGAMKAGEVQKTVLLGRLQDEAVCDGACDFTYSDAATPVISSLSVSSGPAGTAVDIIGTGFGTDQSATKVLFGSKSATISSVSNTQVTVEVPNQEANQYNIKLTFDDLGTASGVFAFTQTIQVTSVSPLTGSTAGTDVTVTGSGFASAPIVTFGSVACLIISASASSIKCRLGASTSTVPLLLSIAQTNSYLCSDASLCGFTFASSSTPSISNPSLSGTTLTVAGSNLSPSPADIRVSVGQVPCTVSASTVTSITAACTPPSGSQPVEVFVSRKGYASGKFSVATTFAATGAAGEGSFGGGMTISMSGSGLGPNTNVTVCGFPCPIVTATYAALTCTSPPLPSDFSQPLYGLIPSDTEIQVGFTATTPSSGRPLSALFDGNFTTYFSSSASPCFLLFDSGPSRKTLLSSFHLYPAEDSLNTYRAFVGTILSYSDDNTTWLTAYTYDVMYAGWNYYNVPLNQNIEDKYPVFKARYFKLSPPDASKCKLAAIQFRGVTTQTDSLSTLNCPVTALDLGTATPVVAGTFTYKKSATPNIAAVSPTIGTTIGGTVLTFTGSLLSTVTGVSIDGVSCGIGTKSDTSFTCTTGARSTLNPPSIQITTSIGNAVTGDVTFLYADRWSSSTTWGGEVPPKKGETVQIPVGMTILLDIPTPELMLLLIEGALIVEDKPGVTLDVNYIFINSGSFQVGTPAHPFQNEFTLTLHGRRASPMMPIYGNKVLAVYCGVLDMHGIPRSVTWTSLKDTILPGATSLKLMVATDWKVDEWIVVAATSYEHVEAEQRKITAISSGTDITVDKPFAFKHYAATETYGTKTVEMRAEVGLLSRNIKITGSVEGTDEEHGAHVMAYAPGDDRVVARISYVEIFNAGQAYSVGAYPFHFHMIGAVRNSFILGNAIHHTYNRAVTIHNIRFLRVIDNVTYHTKGHSIFVEDGAETKNRIERNLVISVRRSWSRLNTDTTPAGIWVTNPDNYVIGNHVAGTDAYGIWFDFHPNPTGPSATTLICPFGTPLGEFRDNVAHSVEKYGFRLFHGHVPLTYPCKPALNPSASDPWADNPPVTAIYRNFLGYKCKRNGAIADKIGDVRWVDFTVADNKLAGIEITYTMDTPPFTIPFLCNATIIGKSRNSEEGVDLSGAIGFIGPQTDGFLGENITFVNFDASMYALGDESHSQACTTRDHGGRHNKLKGLTFIDSTKRVHWEYPRRSFYEILDDSMTGHAGAFVAAFWPHLLWEPYCVYEKALYNGIVCDGTKTLRRVHMLNLQPSTTFFLMQITVRRAAGDNIPLSPAPGRFLQSTLQPDYWWSSMEPVGGAQYHDVPKAWAVPMIMGTEYSVHWGTTPMDWTDMTLRIETFDNPDLWVKVRYNFTDHREMFQVRRGVLPAGTNTSAPNFVDPTLLPSGQSLTPSSPAGASTFDNITKLEFQVMLTGKPVLPSNSGDLTVKAHRCFGTHCVISNVAENVTMETFKRVWSNPNSWVSGAVPVNGERVTILPEWTMVLDCNTAVLSFLEVNGVLQFDNTTSVMLTADIIHVRRGKILSGSPAFPLLPNITHQIVISGTFTSIAYAFDPNIEVVNKAFIVTGDMQLYGARRKAWVHLAENANIGDTVIYVERVNWQPGDQIVLTSSSFYQNETEVATIAAIEAGIDLRTGMDSGQSLGSDTFWQSKETTKAFGRYKSATYPNTYVPVSPNTITKVTLTAPLQYYHAGTILVVNEQSLDMRAEVGVLTSNIVIRGTENGWACNFVVADFVDYDVVNSNPIRRTGTVTLDSIAIDYCGQNSTLRTGLRFESTTLPSTVTNSIVMRSQTYSVNIQNSQNIRLTGNTFFYAVRFGVFVQASKHLLLDGNLMVNVTQRPTVSLPFDKPTGFVICPSDSPSCSNITLVRNVAAGYALLGFAVAGNKCGTTPTFYDNVAHSGVGGWITNNIDGDCMEMSGFTAYFNMETGVVGSMDIPKMTLKNLRLAENYNGYGGNMGGSGEYGNIVTVQDSLILGSTSHSICDPKQCFTPQCGNRRGITLGSYTDLAKQWSINGKLKLPMYNVTREEAFHAEFYYTNLVFANFNLTTECGSNASVVAANELCPDYTPLSVFAKTKLINVASDSLFAMAEPDPVWANIIFCGEFPCTGLKNVVVRDLDGSLVGNSYGGYLLPNNPGITYQSACTYIPRSNGYICPKSPINDFDYALLVFENMDIDARNVTISPTYVASEDPIMNTNATHFYNKMNSFMAMVWDGFYVGMNRLGRFVSAINLNRSFNISFTAIAPNNLRFQLQGAAKETDKVLLTVDYKTPYTVVVSINGTTVPALPFGKVVTMATVSGTNQWLNKDRMLQFMLGPYDMLTLQRVDSIQVSMRMNMTTEDFFASNGPTEFVDRLAAVLGIPPYRIRVVDIRSGSTIVDFALAGDERLASQRPANTNYSSALQEELVRVNDLLLTLAKNGSLVLNAPVLSIETTMNFTTPGNVTNNSPTVITPITPLPSQETPIDPGDGSDDSPVMPWWAYLLIGVGVVVALAVGLYFLYKRLVRRSVPASAPQPTMAFEKIKGDKDHDMEFDIGTSQRSGRSMQGKRA